MDYKFRNKKGITLIALVITVIILLILAGISISMLTSENSIIKQAGKAKEETETSSFKENVDLILSQVQIENYVSNNDDNTTNLENAFKIEDKNATVTKSNAVYEVTFNGEKFLISNDCKYIEVVEPENAGDWEYNSSGIITAYLGNDTNITIPNYINGVRIKKIQHGTFTNKIIESAIISDGIEIIGANLFKESKIKEIIIPDSVIIIEGSAFNHCNNLEYVTFGNNIEEIGPYAFYICTNLKGTLKIPDTLRKIGTSAFNGCSNLEGEYHTPNSLISIEGFAFYHCSKLTGSIEIPSSITTIPNDVFSGCTSLNGTLVIPETIIRIEGGAFSGCVNLNGKLTLPKQLKYIGGGAFQDCRRIGGRYNNPRRNNINFTIYIFWMLI